MKNPFEYKIFIKYFALYLCAVAAFIILIIPIYNTMYQVTKENTVENNAERVYENATMLDAKIEKITTITTHLKNNANIQRLSDMRGELPSNGYFYLIQAQKTLNELRQQYDLDLFAYILFKNNDYFVSESKTAPDYHSIVPEFLDYESDSMDSIRQQAFYNNKNMRFIPAQEISYLNGEVINGLSCIVDVSNKGYGGADYAVVFTIDLNPILKTMKEENRGNEFLQVTDNQGTILLNYDYDGQAIQVEEQGIHDDQISGKDYTLISAKTEYGNLNVTKGIKATVFEAEITDVLRIIQIYIMIAIVLSFFISLILSFRQFRGIRPILNIVKGKSKTSKGKNEYQFIYSSVKNLTDENKRYEEDVLAIRESMRDRLIEKMFLQGIYSEKEKAEFSEYVGSRIQFFCVVSINLIRESDEGINQSFAEQNGKINYYIKNQINKIFSDSLTIYRGLDEVIALIPFRGEDRTSCDKVYSLMRTIAGEVVGVFGQPIEIGISNIGHEINNVHACYQQARRAIRQINDQFDAPVNLAASQMDEFDILEDFNIEQQLFDLIITEDKEAVQMLFQRLNRHMKQYSFSSDQEMMQIFFLIRSPIINARKRILKEEQGIDIPDYNEADSWSRLMESLEETALKLCDFSLQKKKSRSSSLSSGVLNYVNDQYADPNLCAGLVATKFSVSEKYIYKVVKEETGLPFGKYIESIRMQKAKELLRNTDHSAAEISKLVGFQSITTFYKAFNRIFGVAPIAWRESLKK